LGGLPDEVQPFFCFENALFIQLCSRAFLFPQMDVGRVKDYFEGVFCESLVDFLFDFFVGH
jgi:hypothetical protein